MRIKSGALYTNITVWLVLVISYVLPIADAGNLRGVVNSIGISSTGETLNLTDDDSIEFYANEYRRGYTTNEYFEEILLWSKEQNEVDDDYVKSL